MLACSISSFLAYKSFRESDDPKAEQKKTSILYFLYALQNGLNDSIFLGILFIIDNTVDPLISWYDSICFLHQQDSVVHRN